MKRGSIGAALSIFNFIVRFTIRPPYGIAHARESREVVLQKP